MKLYWFFSQQLLLPWFVSPRTIFKFLPPFGLLTNGPMLWLCFIFFVISVVALAIAVGRRPDGGNYLRRQGAFISDATSPAGDVAGKETCHCYCRIPDCTNHFQIQFRFLQSGTKAVAFLFVYDCNH